MIKTIRRVRLLISILLVLIIATTLFPFNNIVVSYAATNTQHPFLDVPLDSYAAKDIADLRTLGITTGIENNKFGYGQPVTRAEFITFLSRLMKWEGIKPNQGSYLDNQDKLAYYYAPVETAVQKGVLTLDEPRFRPNDYATREEMAVMLVRCLGYGNLAQKLVYMGSPFADVTQNIGYITIAKDFGIIKGTGNGFEPFGNALREQAAAMMMRMYNKLKQPIDQLNAFYAISSYSQIDLVDNLSSLSCGWSSLWQNPETGEAFINTFRTKYGYNDFYLPEGFSGVVSKARENKVPALLTVYANTGGVLEHVLTSKEARTKIVREISQMLKNSTRHDIDGKAMESAYFDGVVIDFESMKGDVLKESFNTFLSKLKEELPKDKKIYVAVHPELSKGQPYFDGYDYRTIGEIADKVILMAHDYYPRTLTEADMSRGFKSGALAPIESVYYSLSKMTDESTGVKDTSKIQLQICFDWIEYLTKNGKTIKNTPGKYSLPNFLALFGNRNPVVNYDKGQDSPYLEFTDNDDITHTVWYEDERSIEAKVRLAQLFGINDVSLWRLGNVSQYKSAVSADNSDIFLDIWEKIMEMMRRQ